MSEERRALVVIPNRPGARALAFSLVEGGNVDRALVTHGDAILLQCARVSDTTYGWRTSSMPAPAFAPIIPDTREPVYGMPRWQWDLYGAQYAGPDPAEAEDDPTVQHTGAYMEGY